LNRLFVELYLDEDVDILLAELLRHQGFSATTARSAGQLHKTDAEQLEYAVSLGMTLLTHNRDDFEALARQYFEANRQHYGIIIAVQRPPHQLLRRLDVVLSNITADEMENQLVYI
jgi:predicted nuclease of predicted toxin-antitoxin system